VGCEGLIPRGGSRTNGFAGRKKWVGIRRSVDVSGEFRRLKKQKSQCKEKDAGGRASTALGQVGFRKSENSGDEGHPSGQRGKRRGSGKGKRPTSSTMRKGYLNGGELVSAAPI